MYELRDRIKNAIETLKSQTTSNDSLNIITLLHDTFDIILDRNQELSEALDKLDMLSVDLVRRDTYREALLRIEELEKEIQLLRQN